MGKKKKFIIKGKGKSPKQIQDKKDLDEDQKKDLDMKEIKKWNKENKPDKSIESIMDAAERLGEKQKKKRKKRKPAGKK